MISKDSPQTSLEKGLTLLQHIAAAPELSMSARELSRSTGFNRTTTYRLCDALEGTGWLQTISLPGQSGGRRVGLGPKALGLTVLVGNKYDLLVTLQPLIDALSASVDETIHVAVLDGGAIVHVARAFPSKGLRMAAELGSRAPAHCTALGKAMLATLTTEDVRQRIPDRPLEQPTDRSIGTQADLLTALRETAERGYAIDDEESMRGIMCVAAPIFGPTGQATFAVSVSTLPVNLAGSRLGEVVDGLRKTTALATAAFGGTTPVAWAAGAKTPEEALVAQ